MDNNSVGQIALDLVVNQNQFNKSLNGIKRLAANTGKVLAGAFAVSKITAFGKECLNLGSDLAEVQNVVDVTFTTMNDKVNKFAQNSAAAYGLSETMAKRFTGTFGAMSKAFGFSEAEAYEMSTTLAGLAGDVASFYNITQDQAYTKLKSVFTGETESLKDLGVVMTQTALDSYALANGFGKTVKSMSEAEKVALRYSFVQSQLSAASGDFVRTSGSWANQVRVLSLQFDSLKAAIGQGLITAFTPVIRVVNQLMGKLVSLAQVFASVMATFTGGSGQTATNVLNSIASTAGDAGAAVSGIGDAAESAAKKAKGALAGFDKLNILSMSNDTVPSVGGSSGSSPAINFDYSSADAETENTADRFKATFSKLQTWFKKSFGSSFKQVFKTVESESSKLGSIVSKIFKEVVTLAPSLKNWLSGDLIAVLNESIKTANSKLKMLFSTFNTVFSDIWDIAVWPILQQFVTVGLPHFTDFAIKSYQALQVLYDNIAKVFTLIWREAVSPALKIITDIWTDCVNLLAEKWNQYGAPIFEAVKKALEKTSETLQHVWSNTVKPIWDKLAAAISVIWNDHLKPFTNKLTDFAAVFAQCALDIYNDFILPIVAWFSDVLGPPIINAFSWIIDTATPFIGVIVDWAGNIIDAFTGVIKFVRDIFVGDWSSAWNSVKNIFDKVWSALSNAAKKPINTILSAINSMISGVCKGINTMIRALNRLKFDIPEWVPGLGGESFGFNLKEVSAPKIPLLAEGGFVERNTPQLAIIGDNRHQGEVVSPEDKLLEMAYKAAKMALEDKGSSDPALMLMIISLLKELIQTLKNKEFATYLDGKQVSKQQKNAEKELAMIY